MTVKTFRLLKFFKTALFGENSIQKVATIN